MSEIPSLDDKPKRRWRKRLVYVSLGIVCLLLGLYGFRVPLFSKLIAQKISAQIGIACNAQVEIKSLEGSWINEIILRDFQLSANQNDSSLQRLTFDELKVEYSLWGLLNGASLSDITVVKLQGVDLRLQAAPSPTESTPSTFDPLTLAVYMEEIIPRIDINGICHWQQSNMKAFTQFAISGDNSDIIIALSNTEIENKAYELGLISLKRLDQHTFSLNAPQLHPDLNISNAQCMITESAMDLRLPFTIAQQRQSLSWRASKREQDLICHLDFYFDQSPALLRSFFPQTLPRQGHSRIVANLHRSPSEFDLTCMLQMDNLTWQLDNQQSVKASVTSFIKNNGTTCNIEISDIDFHTQDHQVSISDTVTITSNDHHLWHINKADIKTNSGSLHLEGSFSSDENDLSISWDTLNLAVLSKAFGVQDIEGFCNGSVYFTGSLINPIFKVNLSAPNIQALGHTTELDLACSQDEQGITIDHCYANQVGYLETVILGSWPRRLSINGWEKTTGVAAEISLDLSAKHIQQWPELQGIITQGDIVLHAQITAPAGNPTLHGKVAVQNLSLDAIADHESFALNGDCSFHFDDTQWKTEFQFNQESEQFVKGQIVTDTPLSMLAIDTWATQWKDLVASIKGTLLFKDLQFKLKGTVPRIGDISGEVVINGGRIETQQLSASMGYEPLLMNGFIELDPPLIRTMRLQLQGSRILLVQSPTLRLRADCNLQLSKEERMPFNLRGDVKLTEVLYSAEFVTTNRHTPEVDSQFQLFALPESFLGNAQLDLNVSAQQSIIIHNSMMHAVASGELKVRGTGMVPEPSGDVLIHEENAKLSLPFATIWFHPSTITFKASEPFDPSFAINGHTRMQGYDLRILLKGKMSDFSVNGIDIVSNPPISPEDATRLITTGIPPRDIFDSSKDIDTSGMVIGWAIVETLRKVFGNGNPSRDKIIDRVEVQIGRDVSNNGYNTIEVFLPLYKGYFIKIERDKYEDYNGDIGIKKEW